MVSMQTRDLCLLITCYGQYRRRDWAVMVRVTVKFVFTNCVWARY